MKIVINQKYTAGPFVQYISAIKLFLMGNPRRFLHGYVYKALKNAEPCGLSLQPCCKIVL